MVAALNFLAPRGMLKKSFELGEKPPNPIRNYRRKPRGPYLTSNSGFYLVVQVFLPRFPTKTFYFHF